MFAVDVPGELNPISWCFWTSHTFAVVYCGKYFRRLCSIVKLFNKCSDTFLNTGKTRNHIRLTDQLLYHWRTCCISLYLDKFGVKLFTFDLLYGCSFSFYLHKLWVQWCLIFCALLFILSLVHRVVFCDKIQTNSRFEAVNVCRECLCWTLLCICCPLPLFCMLKQNNILHGVTGNGHPTSARMGLPICRDLKSLFCIE